MWWSDSNFPWDYCIGLLQYSVLIFAAHFFGWRSVEFKNLVFESEYYDFSGTDKALQIPDDLDLTYEGDCTENTDLSSIPSVVFQPPEEEITLNLNNTAPSTSCNITPSTSCQSDSSNSCHQVAASSDACDLLSSEQSGRKTEDFMVDSSCVRAELAEADSTEPSFEFYS